MRIRPRARPEAIAAAAAIFMLALASPTLAETVLTGTQATYSLTSALVANTGIEVANVPADGRELIVHCKMGGRSAKAVALLQERGFTHATNLKGGILAWIDRIDPGQPKY